MTQTEIEQIITNHIRFLYGNDEAENPSWDIELLSIQMFVDINKNYDRRVSELLEANNKLVEEKRRLDSLLREKEEEIQSDKNARIFAYFGVALSGSVSIVILIQLIKAVLSW